MKKLSVWRWAQIFSVALAVSGGVVGYVFHKEDVGVFLVFAGGSTLGIWLLLGKRP